MMKSPLEVLNILPSSAEQVGVVDATGMVVEEGDATGVDEATELELGEGDDDGLAEEVELEEELGARRARR
jgi:hypothetical protein